MRRIELPSEDLAEELHRPLQDKKFTSATYDKARKTVQFPDSMSFPEWASARATAEKWARGRNMEVSESLTLHHKSAPTGEKQEPGERGAELKKRLDGLTPQKAQERYDYLRSRSISELTDAEYEERLALAQTLTGKPKNPKEAKS